MSLRKQARPARNVGCGKCILLESSQHSNEREGILVLLICVCVCLCLCLCIRVCDYVYICVCMCVCARVCVCMRVYVRACVCACVRAYVCVRLYMCVWACVCVCMRARTWAEYFDLRDRKWRYVRGNVVMTSLIICRVLLAAKYGEVISRWMRWVACLARTSGRRRTYNIMIKRAEWTRPLWHNL